MLKIISLISALLSPMRLPRDSAFLKDLALRRLPDFGATVTVQAWSPQKSEEQTQEGFCCVVHLYLAFSIELIRSQSSSVVAIVTSVSMINSSLVTGRFSDSTETGNGGLGGHSWGG